jgi:pimeloyl-ACP methyl ester carboxylesterase
MKLVAVACVLAVACGGSTPRPVDDDSAAFANKRGFQPTAFHVDVRGEGTPVIFVPGLGCPGSVFDDAITRLNETVPGGIQAHVLTLAGFAGEDPIKPPLAAKTRKELVRYIRSRHLDHPIVVGHSMGGFIAYWLAATSSDALGGIVVVDAGPALANADDDDAHRLRNTWAQAGDDELPAQIKTVYSWMVRDPSTIAPYLDTIAKSDRQTIGDSIYELVKTDITSKLADISVPLLLVLADGGLQNGYKKQVSSIEQRQVVVLPRTRHFVWLDDPAGFAKVVGAFIAKHAP